MGFETILGNQMLLKALSRASQSQGRALSHAYLLHGTAGTGKKRIARLFAAGIFCGEENAPCLSCGSCRKVEKEIHPDLTILHAPEGKLWITVEQIRLMREDIFIRPNDSDYRVVIIEESEQMNQSAANALLKVLEEPPPYVVFILTANNLSRLPETIASRCLCLETQELPLWQAERWLMEQAPEAGASLLSDAILYGGGNLGRCKTFLTEETAKTDLTRVLGLIRSFSTKREFDILEQLAPLEGDREGFFRLLADFQSIIGRAATARYRPELEPSLVSIGEKLRPLQAVALHTLAGDIRMKLLQNGNLTLLLSLFCGECKNILETL